MRLRTSCPFLYPPWYSRVSRLGIETRPRARGYASPVSIPRPKAPAQQSMRIAMQQQLKELGIPNDVGLLDGGLSLSMFPFYTADNGKGLL